MLILGTTADDKGAQLEALVHATLTADGYQNIRRNEIREGGNEIDVVAERVSPVLGGSQVTQVICEAKAYADPVSSPNWQRFLGKVFLARSEDPSAVGVFIALNGVNGNVSGSHNALRRRDQAVLIIVGTMLEEQARLSGELVDQAEARAAIAALYHREPTRIEAAYYGGAWRWVAWWGGDEYSIVGGRGELLAAHAIEALRPALEASVAGSLVTAADAQVAAEARHAIRLEIFNKLFYGVPVPVSAGDNEDAVAASLGEEPFCDVIEGQVVLLRPESMDARAICRLFIALFQNSVRVEQLGFIADGFLNPYVGRLIDVLPEVQAGFTLDHDGETTLRAVAPLFPSIWVLLAQPIEFMATHGNSSEERNDVLMVDRNAFWEEITRTMQTDFANPAMRGFLYEHLGVVELEEARSVRVKSKTGLVATVRVDVRNAIGQLSDEFAGEAGTRHMVIRVLPGIAEPWEGQKFPEPTIELHRPLVSDSGP